MNGNTEIWNFERGERLGVAHESRWKVLEGGPALHELVIVRSQVCLGGRDGLVVTDENGHHAVRKEHKVFAMSKAGNDGIFLCRASAPPRAGIEAAYYDTRTGVAWSLEVDAEAPKKILTSSSGRLAAVISYDGAMQCWDIESRRQTWSRPELRRVRDRIRFLTATKLPFPAIEAGEQLVVSTGRRILCRSFATGQDIRVWKVGAQARGLAYDVACHQLFASFPDGTIRNFDLQSGAENIVFTQAPIGVLALSPDRKLLLSGAITLGVLDLTTGRQLTTLRGHCLRINSFAFTADDRLVTGSQDETVRFWDLRVPEVSHQPRHTGGVIRIRVAGNRKYAVTAAADDKVGIWDLDAPSRTALMDSGARLAIAVSDDSQRVIVGTKNFIEWRAIPSGEVLHRIRVKGFVMRLVALTKAEQIAAALDDGTVLLVSSATGRKIWSKAVHLGYCNGLRVSQQETRVLSWGDTDDRTVKVHERATGSLISTFGGFDDAVEDAWFFENGAKVLAVVGGWWDEFDTRLHILNVETGQQTFLRDEMVDGSVEFSRLAVSADERYAVVACNATEETAFNPLRVWNLVTLRRERYLHSFGSVRSVAMIGNTYAVAACTDHCIRVWELSTGTLVAQHRGQSEMWSCAAEGDVVVAGEQSGTVHLLRLHL